jgi:hypothetical protein
VNILGHYSYTFGVDRAEVRVLKEAYEISFGTFLQGLYRCSLKAEIGLEVLSNLANEALEGQLADE